MYNYMMVLINIPLLAVFINNVCDPLVKNSFKSVSWVFILICSFNIIYSMYKIFGGG